jgi:GT2 family glycosyltransferase
MTIALGPGDAAASTSWPLVTVVVPVYDHAERLQECLAALATQDYPGGYDVLVVDNGSSTPLASVVGRTPRARLTREPQAGSYAARNRGVREATGEVLAFTDADCVPHRDWLTRGVEALRADPACGLVAGRIQLQAADPARPTAAELYESVAGFRQQEYVDRWRFGATANLFTLRSVFDRVGPFDERLRSLGDREWGRRVFDRGFTQRYAEAARVRHPARRSVPALLQRTRRMAGGYYAIARSGMLPPGVLLRDAPMGLASRRTPAGALGPRGVGQHATVALVTLAVLAVRVLELARLCAGGRPQRC